MDEALLSIHLNKVLATRTQTKEVPRKGKKRKGERREEIGRGLCKKFTPVYTSTYLPVVHLNIRFLSLYSFSFRRADTAGCWPVCYVYLYVCLRSLLTLSLLLLFFFSSTRCLHTRTYVCRYMLAASECNMCLARKNSSFKWKKRTESGIEDIHDRAELPTAFLQKRGRRNRRRRRRRRRRTNAAFLSSSSSSSSSVLHAVCDWPWQRGIARDEEEEEEEEVVVLWIVNCEFILISSYTC